MWNSAKRVSVYFSDILNPGKKAQERLKKNKTRKFHRKYGIKLLIQYDNIGNKKIGLTNKKKGSKTL